MQFLSFTGVVKHIQPMETGRHGGGSGCTQLFMVESDGGEVVNFHVSRDTYFVRHETVRIGDRVTGFYDANAPTPLIYPPQYQAIVMSKVSPNYFVKVSFFDRHLVSEDGQLRLNVSADTRILLENDQLFQGSLHNRNLIVLYGPTTRSIPAQTTPYEIIVLCRNS